MKVGIFLKTTSGTAKKNIMLDFAKGVKKCGDEIEIFDEDAKYHTCDLALIFGFYGANLGEIQSVRQRIYETHYLKNKKYCLFIDADLLRFAGKIRAEKASDESQHLRISHKSIYPGEANYFNENSHSDRWEILQKRKKIEVLPYRSDGEHILICMNSLAGSGRGWSTKGLDITPWLFETLKEIRAQTSRPIIIRFHPNEKDEIQNERPLEEILKFSDVYASGGVQGEHKNLITGTDLIDDCKNAWAAIVYNTSASVIPIIKGIPVFTSNKNCIAYPIANQFLEALPSPKLFDREQWFYNLAYSCWNCEELREGILWKRFQARLNSRGDYSLQKAKLLGL